MLFSRDHHSGDLVDYYREVADSNAAGT